MKRLVLLLLAAAATAAAQPSMYWMQPHCSVQTVAGTYSASYIGWTTIVQPGAQPMTYPGTILGVMSINLDGTVTGVGAVSGFGPVTDYAISGTIEINVDCTGTIRMKVKPKSGGGSEEMIEVDRFVFDPNEGTILTTIVDMGPGYYPAILGTWKRMSRTPNLANW